MVLRMRDIFQQSLPHEMHNDVRLPGITPCDPDDWLRVDEAYAEQMVYRAHLLACQREDVLWSATASSLAQEELLEKVLSILPGLGFQIENDNVTRPDGEQVVVDWSKPLLTLGHLVQEDLCILQKSGTEHVLTAAVLCFPASWRLAEKAGQPLTQIHVPVPEYDADIARRVQRLFDGVKAGRPLWRFNRLTYSDSDLHQPFPKPEDRPGRYLRSERQCILRLPRTQAVVFTIHTWILPGTDIK
jgi:hypothetical protein